MRREGTTAQRFEDFDKISEHQAYASQFNFFCIDLKQRVGGSCLFIHDLCSVLSHKTSRSSAT